MLKSQHPVHLRAATLDDIPRLVRLTRIGSAGLMDAVYMDSEPGLSTNEVLTRRFSDPYSVHGYRNFEVATMNDQAIGQICTWPEEDFDLDILFEHLTEERREILETFTSISYPDSLYIFALSVSRRFRGTDTVRMLLNRADEKAREMGMDHVSIHAFGDNSAAISLYCRMGYKIYDSKQPPPDPRLVYSGPVLLLAKEVKGPLH